MDELEDYLHRIASSLEAIEAQNQDIAMSLEQIRSDLSGDNPLSTMWSLRAEIEDIKSSLDMGISDILASLQAID